jgi:hypothetical protein
MRALPVLPLAIVLVASAFIDQGTAISVVTTALSSGSDDGYDVALQVSHAGGGSTWRYTITKITEDAKDLGHFIVDFDTCGGQSPTVASILSATVNGVNWLDHIEATEGVVTGCSVPSTNFVKFDEKNSNPTPGVPH